ncbi:MAG: ATP-binding protein [bacterium]
MKFNVFDNQIDAVMIIDAEKHPLYVNLAFATMVGASPKRIKPDKFAYDYITFENKDLLPMPEGTMGFDCFTPYQETKFNTFKGAQGTALVSIMPIEEDNQEEIRYWALFMKDMTVEIQLQEKYKDQLNQKEGVIKELQKAQAELNEYSQNLEKMVQERTQELAASNRFIQAMVNSLNEGLFVFNSENMVLDHYTRICEDIFETSLKDKKIWEIFGVNEKEKNTIINWSSCLFDNLLPFEDAIVLGPSEINKEGKIISLKYFPMMENEQLEGVVVVAEDVSEAMAIKKELEEMQTQAAMLMKIIKNKDQFIRYARDSKTMVAKIVEQLQADLDVEKFHSLNRVLHTIKGSSSIFNISKLVEMAHNYEEEMSPYKDFLKEQEEEDFLLIFQEQVPKIVENLHTLDHAMDEIYTEFDDIFGGAVFGNESKIEVDSQELIQFSRKLDKDLREDFKSKFIKRSAYTFVSAYELLVSQLAEKQEKLLAPIFWENEDVKLDPDRYADLFNSLVHYFRNMVDHGIEPPEKRKELGKDPEGKISVSFEVSDKGDESFFNILSLKITDDGKGINPGIIREKLLEKGFDPKEVNAADDHQILQYIFEQGFSTASAVTDVSGRGIGMDAIKNCVTELGGSIYVESQVGVGTSLHILLPDE